MNQNEAAKASAINPDDAMPVTIEIINGPKGLGLDKLAAGPNLHAFVLVYDAETDTKKNYYFTQNGNPKWSLWVNDIQDGIANGKKVSITYTDQYKLDHYAVETKKRDKGHKYKDCLLVTKVNSN